MRPDGTRPSIVRQLCPLAVAAALALGCESVAPNEELFPAGEPAPAVAEVYPAISGGTLAITPDGATAIVGDPDRGFVYVADIDPRQVRARIALAGEPGRVAVDPDSRLAFVALRTGGEVAVIDVIEGTLVDRWTTCGAPRGIDVAPDGETVFVACAGGYLVSHRIGDGRVVRRVEVAPDLRDVVAFDDRLEVSVFRTAELITLELDGSIRWRTAPDASDLRGQDQTPTVAWRLVRNAQGGVTMLHQRSSDMPVGIDAGPRSGYTSRGECNPAIVESAVTHFPAGLRQPHTRGLPGAVLAVDVVPTVNGVAVAAPGNTGREADSHIRGAGRFTLALHIGDEFGRCLAMPRGSARGQITAVAARPNGDVYGFQRNPAALVDADGQPIIWLPADDLDPAADRGHQLFHTAPGAELACASCHPEGSEDGHVWNFQGLGPRRTQELRGGISGSAPFHWQQDMADMLDLLQEVMTGRMSGDEVTPADAVALSDWLDGQVVPRVHAIGEGDPVAGRGIFESPMAGCADCHSGPRLSDGWAHDVGSGERLETPTLIAVGRRARLMHHGCATSLEARFDPACGGRAHGRVDHLDLGQMNDLLAYLRSL